MNYFDDLQFVAADILEHYTDTIDKCYTDIYTVEFILAGAMFHGIDGGAPEKIITPAVFWHHPAHRYHYGPLPPDGEWHHHWVSFRGARGRRLLENGFMKLSPRGFVSVAQPLAVARIFQQLLEKTAQPLPQAQAEAVVLLEQLLCMLMEQARGMEEPYSDRITALCDAVQDNPCCTMDFEKKARAMGISYSHFRRLFRQRTGRPPHDYLLLCRMQHAADALKDRSRSIKEVAMESGYEDPAQFTKLFRQKTGLSPRQFRQALPSAE